MRGLVSLRGHPDEIMLDSTVVSVAVCEVKAIQSKVGIRCSVHIPHSESAKSV